MTQKYKNIKRGDILQSDDQTIFYVDLTSLHHIRGSHKGYVVIWDFDGNFCSGPKRFKSDIKKEIIKEEKPEYFV